MNYNYIFYFTLFFICFFFFTDKEFLTNFLIGCKNSLEKAKVSLNKYYIFKTKSPEIYMNRDPCSEEFKKCMKTM